MPVRLRLLLVPLCAAGLAACASGPSTSRSSSSTTGAPASSTTSSTARSTTPTSGATTSSTSQTTGTLVPQTPTGTEFLSPSGNISCEIDYNFGPDSITQTGCFTGSPPKSVTLKTDGTLTECTGVQCLSNPGLDTPTLHYGMSITLGPFSCSSSTAGMTCTLANGDGFLISSAAVTPLGRATVTSTTG